METVVLNVEGMSCSHCENAVQQALLALPGVKKAKADNRKKTAKVKYDSALTPLEQLRAAIVEAGYEVVA